MQEVLQLLFTANNALLINVFIATALTCLLVFWWQYRRWRRAESKVNQTLSTHAALQAAIDASPDGYFAWFYGTDNSGRADRDITEKNRTGVCSRRVAVLLDLFRGMDSVFEDILDGFEAEGAQELHQAVQRLHSEGFGFTIEVQHAGTGQKIQIRGVRGVGDNGQPLVDLLWMSDMTEAAAAVNTLSRENTSLRIESDRLRTALDGIGAPIWLRDDDLSLIYCNEAYVKAVNAETSKDVVTRGRELAPRASVREVRALAAAARASGVARQGSHHMVVDGSRRLMEVTESPVTLDESVITDERRNSKISNTSNSFGNGSRRLTSGIAYDVTKREELEIKIKRETSAHADVLERLGTAIAIFGSDTRILFHNTAYMKLWRLESAWISERPSYGDILETLRKQRRLPEVADFPSFKEQELKRFNSLIDPLEDVMHLPDGVTLRRVVAPHPMGGLLTTYEDVTDTLAMERSYNTLIAVQRETIDNLHEAVAVFGANGLLRLANPAFADLWGFNIDELHDRSSVRDVMDQLRLSVRDSQLWEHHQTALLGILKSGGERSSGEGQLNQRDGKLIDFKCVPLPDGGVLCSYKDASHLTPP